MKNPFMSMWLSGANKAAGSARGLWMAEAQRQQKALLKAATGAAPAKKKCAVPKRKTR